MIVYIIKLRRLYGSAPFTSIMGATLAASRVESLTQELKAHHIKETSPDISEDFYSAEHIWIVTPITLTE